MPFILCLSLISDGNGATCVFRRAALTKTIQDCLLHRASKKAQRCPPQRVRRTTSGIRGLHPASTAFQRSAGELQRPLAFRQQEWTNRPGTSRGSPSSAERCA
eukprot:CAMPEP_0117542044 /NCGR_PEP_ID=MMETSP0784-20121206/44333_1 /TAXON_ID=39447 /ORGANISM="" /LENGTH=102 /DNA_ID=CAMNT_0005338761 /DNA_START=26 /DNA_END=334 /DNA_ORIENTATION=-